MNPIILKNDWNEDYICERIFVGSGGEHTFLLGHSETAARPFGVWAEEQLPSGEYVQPEKGAFFNTKEQAEDEIARRGELGRANIKVKKEDLLLKASASVSQKTPKPPSKPFYNLEDVRAIPLADICTAYDIPTVQRGESLWANVRGERTPSCKFYPENTFCDFGAGNIGGDNISFICYIKGRNHKDHEARSAAIIELGERFGLKPENHVKGARPSSELSNGEWATLGIQGETAAVNLIINPDSFNAKNLQEFLQKFSMTVNELKLQQPEVYAKMLKARVMPQIFDERSYYYASLLTMQELAHESYIKAGQPTPPFAELMKTSLGDDINKTAAELNRAERALAKAVDGTSLKFYPKTHSPAADYQKIEAGKISVELSSTSFYDIKHAAAMRGAEPFCSKISLEDYQALRGSSEGELPRFSAVRKGGEITLTAANKKDMGTLTSAIQQHQEISKAQSR